MWLGIRTAVFGLVDQLAQELVDGQVRVAEVELDLLENLGLLLILVDNRCISSGGGGSLGSNSSDLSSSGGVGDDGGGLGGNDSLDGGVLDVVRHDVELM